MEVTGIKIIKREFKNPLLRAYMDITLNNSLEVYGLKILQRYNNSQALVMPDLLDGKERVDVFHPVNAPTRKWLETIIFDVYKKCEKVEDEIILSENEPSLIGITSIRPFITKNSPEIKDRVSIVLENQLTFFVRVRQKENNNDIFYLDMPHIIKSSGQRENIVCPLTPQMSEHLKTTVLADEGVRRLILKK